MNWNRRILSLLGNWPEDHTPFRLLALLIYTSIHVSTQYTFIVNNIRNLEAVTVSLTETLPFTAVLYKALLFVAKKKSLCSIIGKMRENISLKDYRTDEEVKIHLYYDKMSKIFIIIVPAINFVSSISYFAKPLVKLFGSMKGGNDTLIFDLPYHACVFYDIENVRNFAVTYTIQTPLVVIVVVGYLGSDCLLVTLGFHVSSEFSILAYRIKNLTYDALEFEKSFKSLVKRHLYLIGMADDLTEAFNTLLLAQLLTGTFLVCFLGYDVLLHSTGGEEAAVQLDYLGYGLSIVLLIFVYCYIGECLTQSNNLLQEAYFECLWYEMPVKNSKSIIMCIRHAQRPLHLYAGKFYVLSLEMFTQVMKTSVAYLSVLRNFQS